MKITIELVVDVDPKVHPIPDLVERIKFRTCTIPGVIDANGKETGLVALQVLDEPPKAAA